MTDMHLLHVNMQPGFHQSDTKGVLVTVSLGILHYVCNPRVNRWSNTVKGSDYTLYLN